MPKHTFNWVNDHTQICDRLDERVQLMEDYLDSKPDDFDGIAVKRFLLSQAREQISWYRQSIDALDLWDASPAVAPSKQDRVSWSTISLPITSEKPSGAQNISAIPNSRSYPRCGHGSMMRGISMLVKLQTTKFLIYAELDKTERVTQEPDADRGRACDTLRTSIVQYRDARPRTC